MAKRFGRGWLRKPSALVWATWKYWAYKRTMNGNGREDDRVLSKKFPSTVDTRIANITIT